MTDCIAAARIGRRATAAAAMLSILWVPSPAACSGFGVVSADIVVRVALDGSMVVHETIVTHSGKTHAPPYRDIADHAIPGAARQQRREISVLHVGHGRHQLPWWGEPIPRGLRIHFGAPGRKLPAGERTYELLYHVDRQLAVDGGREWLLWRPLGPGFDWPLNSLHVSVTFPRELSPDAIHLTVPPEAEHHIADDGTVRLAWSKPVPPHREVAFLASWPRGFLNTDTDSEQAPWLRPRMEILWWTMAGLLISAALVAAGLRHTRAHPRTAAIVGAAAISIASLYIPATVVAADTHLFRTAIALALAAGAFPWLTRGLQLPPRYRIVRLATIVTLVTSAAALLTWTVSPWYSIAWIAHIDLWLIAGWLFAGNRRIVCSVVDTASASSSTARGRNSALDTLAGATGYTHTPAARRRVPVLDVAPGIAHDGGPFRGGGERRRRQSSSG